MKKITSIILTAWYIVMVLMMFIAPASGILIIVTFVIEKLWNGPLKRNGLKWKIRKRKV